MEHSIKAPEVGESITEVRIQKWLKADGAKVSSGDVLVEIETDKASVEVTAENDGALKIVKAEGETVPIGETIAVIDDAGAGKSAEKSNGKAKTSSEKTPSVKKASSGGKKVDVKAPEVGESITEVKILSWNFKNGDAVESGDVLAEIESDKASVEVSAESSGALEILAKEGTTVSIGAVIAHIDPAKDGNVGKTKSASTSGGATPSSNASTSPTTSSAGRVQHAAAGQKLSPSVQKMATERNIDLNKVQGSGRGGRMRKEDLLRYLNTGGGKTTATGAPNGVSHKDRPGDRRETMSRLRQTIAERLVYAQHSAAILTTFNEVDMQAVMDVRAKHKDSFQKKYGVKLSFMSFFTRAVVETLKELPEINASIDGDDIVYHDYYDIGVAVGTDRGLVVPVLRNVENQNFADIEKNIGLLAQKARDKKLSIAEMTGGTFTISNGGTYGSMMSTPILNPPQSGILGMHNIIKRPIAIDDQVVIRPMMYTALSYDHRIVDGKGAVTFLVSLKNRLENPESLKLDFI